MTITLNPRNIFDEIFAISALAAHQQPEVELPHSWGATRSRGCATSCAWLSRTW